MLAELYADPSTSITMHAMKCIDEHQCGSVANCYIVLQEEVPSIVDCPDPDHMTPHERRVARIAHEEASFDAEYYLADLMDNNSIDDLLKFEPPWREELVRWRRQRADAFASATAVPLKSHATEPGQDILPFSAEERDQLKELPSKECILSCYMLCSEASLWSLFATCEYLSSSIPSPG